MSRAVRERPRVALAGALFALLLLGAGAMGATLADSEPQTPLAVQARVQRLETSLERQQRSLDAARSAADQRDTDLERAQERAGQLRRANTTLRRRISRLRRTQRRRQTRSSQARPARPAVTNPDVAPEPPSLPAAPVQPERPSPNSPPATTAARGNEFEP